MTASFSRPQIALALIILLVITAALYQFNPLMALVLAVAVTGFVGISILFAIGRSVSSSDNETGLSRTAWILIILVIISVNAGPEILQVAEPTIDEVREDLDPPDPQEDDVEIEELPGRTRRYRITLSNHGGDGLVAVSLLGYRSPRPWPDRFDEDEIPDDIAGSPRWDRFDVKYLQMVEGETATVEFMFKPHEDLEAKIVYRAKHAESDDCIIVEYPMEYCRSPPQEA